MPSANMVHKNGEHQNTNNVEYYEHNPEYLITSSLQMTQYKHQL